MKKYLYVLIAWMLPLCSIHAQAPVWNPDNGNGTFTNPIMWGDWPDPDVIRVGDDFYFVSTSMHYVPGCPIATSIGRWQDMLSTDTMKMHAMI